jgi:acetyltransferase-like isoleucine patch superfamily enzyme
MSNTQLPRPGWLSWLWHLEARLKGAEFEGASTFQGRPQLARFPGSRLTFGPGVCITSTTRHNPLGFFQPCVLKTWAPKAQLRLGPGVRLYGAILCAAVNIDIGEGSVLDWGAMVMDTDFHWPVGEVDWLEEDGSRARPIRIGRGVLIGPRAVVIKGVTIGDRAIIQPGAVVTKDVPAGQTVAGNPARSLG